MSHTAVHTTWTKQRLSATFHDPATLDPIEGFWAVVVSTTNAAWNPGELKARLTRRPDGRFDVVYRMGDHSTRHQTAWLSRGTLLQMYGGIAWGKRAPLSASERGALDARDPLAPTIRTVGHAVVVTVPSHDGAYRSVLDSLVATNHQRLLGAEPLIIDRRGDAGGGSRTTASLMPFIYATPERNPPGAEGEPVVLASPENLAYFSRWKSADHTPQWLIDLLARMGQHYGEIVDFQDSPDTTEGWAPDTNYATPRHVAVLTDRGVASAGEAFLLFALHSPRVTTFGEPTWGMIDYQNVSVVPLGCPGSGMLLGYPTIASSRHLPKGGLNATGIVPDVPLDLARGDVITEVIAHYAGR